MRLHPISDPPAASAAKTSYDAGPFGEFEWQRAELEIPVKGLKRASRGAEARDPRESRLSLRTLSFAAANALLPLG